jgi:hypothetical protein
MDKKLFETILVLALFTLIILSIGHIWSIEDKQKQIITNTHV